MARISASRAGRTAPLADSIRTLLRARNSNRRRGRSAFRAFRSERVRSRRGPGIPIALACAALLLAACESSPAERREAIYDLRDDPTEQHVEKIRGYLDDPDRNVRATALNVLVGLEVPDAVALARRALEDPDGFVRATAAKLLGETRDPAHAPPLAERLLEDPDPIARQRAAEALARVGGPAAVEALARGVEDPMDRVRLAAVEGLRRLGPAPAIEGLIRLLREDAVWEVRAQAASALGSTGDKAAIPALEGALDDPNEYVRSAAANALRQLGSDRGP